MSENQDSLVKTIAILGGTGKEGSALAKRWALNGYKVVIGSRSADKAVSAANQINLDLGGDYISGADNAEAAREGGLVVLSVPYSAHHETLESVRAELAGKVLVDLTVPIMPPDFTSVYIPAGKSAAQEAQALLGADVKVVSAFQNVSYVKIKNPDAFVDCDVLVTGDDDDAKAEVLALVEAAGMRGIDAGSLANSTAAEALTPVLLYINRKYGAKGAGIRITGLG